MASTLTYTDRQGKTHEHRIGTVDRARLVILARSTHVLSQHGQADRLSTDQLIGKHDAEVTLAQMRGTLAAIDALEAPPAAAASLAAFLRAAVKDHKRLTVS